MLDLKSICSSTYADINSIDQLKNSIRDSDPHIVIHLAAQPLVLTSVEDPVSTIRTNALGTVNLLESCRDLKSCKSILVITTDKCYIPSPDGTPLIESSKLGGNDPYSASKACAELLTYSYRTTYFNQKNSSSLSTARAGNVIGGGDWSDHRLMTDIVNYIWNNIDTNFKHTKFISVSVWYF